MKLYPTRPTLISFTLASSQGMELLSVPAAMLAAAYISPGTQILLLRRKSFWERLSPSRRTYRPPGEPMTRPSRFPCLRTEVRTRDEPPPPRLPSRHHPRHWLPRR